MSSTSRDGGVNYLGFNNGIWTSGTRQQDKVHWLWLAQEPFVYTKWDTLFGEPNNGTGNEECLQVINNGTTTDWNDIACNRLFYPLCEKQSAAWLSIFFHCILGVKNIGINNAIWISGNRRQDKVHWVWLTQEALVYTSWDLVFHEPNNATGDEECVSIISNNGTVTTWNDIACNRLFYPLCEKQICCSGCNCGCS
uniref:Uncharacterized protein LOC114331397 n=1 Tax=Diabrotica virgifera virgifera TaxID=50390 RepID=A0A6P7FPS9_DIAVI